MNDEQRESELYEKLEQVKTRRDLVEFISDLHQDLENHPEDWENPSLLHFLQAMGSWVGSMDYAYRNVGIEFSEDQPWKLFGRILFSARSYE